MTLTLEKANDVICSLFNVQWGLFVDPDEPFADPPRVYWDDVDETLVADGKNPPPVDRPFAKVAVEPVSDEQVGIAEVGYRRFRRYGRVMVLCAAPLSRGKTLSLRMAQHAELAFKGRLSIEASGVTFLNVLTRDAGRLNQWFCHRVFAEYEYDEHL